MKHALNNHNKRATVSKTYQNNTLFEKIYDSCTSKSEENIWTRDLHVLL